MRIINENIRADSQARIIITDVNREHLRLQSEYLSRRDPTYLGFYSIVSVWQQIFRLLQIDRFQPLM